MNTTDMSLPDFFVSLMEKKAFFLFFGLMIILFYLMPFFLYGEKVFIGQYDNLDSNIVWLKILAESGRIFAPSNAIIPNMMGGLPRLSYNSELSFFLLLFVLFKPFTVYVINEVLMHVVAFLGMFFLTERYIFTERVPYRNLYVFIPSIAFAILPFWPWGGVSAAGLPLALLAFLNIRNGSDSKWDWLILLLLPFYSSIILTFFFFLVCMGIVFLHDVITLKRFNLRFLMAMVLMLLVYLVVEYRLVYAMFFDSGFVSHRTEFAYHTASFRECYKGAHERFLDGIRHTQGLQFLYILPSILLAFLLSFMPKKLSALTSGILLVVFILLYEVDGWNALLSQKYSLPILLLLMVFVYILKKEVRLLNLLMILQILFAYWGAFWFDSWWAEVAKHFSLINTFNFTRFAYMATPLWYIMFAMALKILSEKILFAPLFIVGLAAAQLYLAFLRRDFFYDPRGQITFKSYFAKDLFNEVKHYIGMPQNTYRVASLGVVPAVTLYNGFYTVDGYSANYPLSYKHQFLKMLAPAMKQIRIQGGDNFVLDSWGSKLYLMMPGVSYYLPQAYDRKKVLNDFYFDTQRLHDLNATYLLSTNEINNSKVFGLEFMKKFSGSGSYWDVFLYRIDPQKD